jgi:F-type H+-transporting ATPase subunit b
MKTDLLLAAAADAGSPGMIQQVAEQFGVDWPHFIAQCLSFIIVAGLLYKFAYKPVLGVLEERRRRIAEGLENADKIKKELATAQTKAHEIMAQANAQGRR